jgi:cytosine/adenosine deaminase-related metal-dependent hydrolase
VRELAGAGKLALATDSRLSGEFDLLAELKKAAGTGQVDARGLFLAVTRDAARLLGLRGRGSIETGARADLVLLPPAESDPPTALIAMERRRIRMVMIAGKPRVAAPELEVLFEKCGLRSSPCRVDGEERLVWRPLVKQQERCAAREPGFETG